MTEQQATFYGELFQKLSLTELKIEEEGTSLLLKKEPAVPTGVQMVYAGSAAGSSAVQGSADGSVQGSNAGASAAQSISEKQYDEIKAPLLGIFHRAPSPNEPVFVEEGDAVKKGDVLCVIEAMKMMNEITAGRDGVIVSVCAEENAIVEYGQKIFEIM